MEDIKKSRRPGRSVFFEKESEEESLQEELVATAYSAPPEAQLKDLLNALKAMRKGDFTVKLDFGNSGIFEEIANAYNDVVEMESNLTNEFVRASKIIGEEGNLAERASIGTLTGSWKIKIDSINSLINNLAQPAVEFARVIGAVAEGSLTRKMTLEIEGRPLKGEYLRIGNRVNTMVDQLSTFASEVTRVAREVGTEGKLGGQAEVKGVAGTWKDLTDSVNAMASNLTGQVRNIADVTTAVALGDLSRKITAEAKGEILQLKDTINKMVDQLNGFASEVTRVAREVGTEGKLGGQAEVKGVAGTWKELTDNVNMMASNLTGQVRNIADVTTAVANGDLSKKITAEAKGEILQLKDTINKMVDQLNGFASEVTRVAREVGSEGKLGGQANVPGVAGTWKDLTDNVNMLAGNLTSQVRNIAVVTTAVATGDLSQKITVTAQGEILELKNTINGMVDNLNTIIGNINKIMALVGKGTLTQLIEVDARGEFASMVNGINGTIESLRGIVSELTEAGINIGSVSQKMLQGGQEMNSMVSQLSGSVEQIADGAKTQAQQIVEASRESEGVGRTASNTLNQSESMNKMAEVATNSAVDGSKAMNDTIKNTDLMLMGSKESVGRIESLSKSSEQIQEIVDVIRDIATQTNILAINAAIEAVRAGKQGKGFAVVAEEVKTLSADSKAQAKKISSLVQSVLRETLETVETIKTMAENVEMGKRSIEQTSKSFGDINQSIEVTSKTAKEISVAAAEQKKSIDAVSQSLDKISGIATDTSTAATQSAESGKRLLGKTQELMAISTTLADMSEKFQKTVERFDISEEKGKPIKPKKAVRTAA
jgi:methyl-accepting chemotaxis protein